MRNCGLAVSAWLSDMELTERWNTGGRLDSAASSHLRCCTAVLSEPAGTQWGRLARYDPVVVVVGRGFLQSRHVSLVYKTSADAKTNKSHGVIKNSWGKKPGLELSFLFSSFSFFLPFLFSFLFFKLNLFSITLIFIKL